MKGNRLEAFSDGVIAIIITIMVLELKVPHGQSWADVLALWPVFLSYMLSFINVGIFWVNHHHLMHTVRNVSGAVLWANLNLLFWLSLMPFTTAWMGENNFSATPVALYCLNLLVCGLAHFFLQSRIIKLQGQGSLLRAALGQDMKGKLSLAGHVASTLLAFFNFTVAAGLIEVAIAIFWLSPDKRIEQVFNSVK